MCGVIRGCNKAAQCPGIRFRAREGRDDFGFIAEDGGSQGQQKSTEAVQGGCKPKQETIKEGNLCATAHRFSKQASFHGLCLPVRYGV